MKYLLLINNDAAAAERWRSLSPAEAQKLREKEMPRWNELFQWMGERGIEVQGLELADPGEARVVRVRDRETFVSDGPFAETKELLGGYLLAELDDLDQAIEIAERIPTGKGSIEIRPLATQ